MSAFSIEIFPISIPLKRSFGISRGSKDAAENVIIKIQKDDLEGFGEAAPNYRYDEYQSTVVDDLNQFDGSIEYEIETIEGIKSFFGSKSFRSKSGQVALEMAMIDWLGKSKNTPSKNLLGIDNSETPSTSYTIGIDQLDVIREKVIEAENAPILKVKLGTDFDRDIIRTIREITMKPIRVDANEGWFDLDTAKREIEFLASQSIELVEQPMPSDSVDDLRKLKEWSPLPLFADESFKSIKDLEVLVDQFHGINIKLMKTGSIIDSLEIIKKSNELGLQVMVGCMIESSLAISAGALVGYEAEYVDLDGALLIAEDPFSGLNMNDELQIIASNKPGLGVSLLPDYFN